ncbi:MAG: hypothetical protein RDU76_03790 [Candidatus Edwardsbacteria bacterium]|nr:hypothetical protein [Candidatus Edwardsbacteria bacterium]
MSLQDALKTKLAGQKAAFVIDGSGKCQQQGGDESAILQSTQFAKQIYDIVGLSSLDTLWVSAGNGTFVTKTTSQGQAGLMLDQNPDIPAAMSFLDRALSSSEAGPAAGTGDVMGKVRKIASEYLTDFADTALMIQVKQAGLDEKNPQPEQLEKLAAGLEKAALMITGPEKAREMAEQIRKAIK